MKLELANITDLDKVMLIINEARYRLKSQGLSQWNTKDGYPTILDMEKDIFYNHLYVVRNEQDILGCMAIIKGIDENYQTINGKWLSDNEYITIHRIAVGNKALSKHIGAFMIDEAKKLLDIYQVDSIKADTHKDNKIMLKLLLNHGFIHCGQIELKSREDNKREAFEYKRN